MARRSSRRPRPPRAEEPKVEGAEPEAPLASRASLTPSPEVVLPPAKADSNLLLAIIGFSLMGALGGTATALGNWGLSPMAGAIGLVAGLVCGATAGHSLMLQFRWQCLVMGLLVVLCFAFYHWIGPVGLIMAGGSSLILSAWLERRRREPDVTARVTLLHTNDMHDQRSALRKLDSLIRPDRCVLVDVGDSIRGSNTRWYWDEPIMDQMNGLHYQAQAMGNREFHYLRRVLAHRTLHRTFPLLAANLEDLREPAGQWWSEKAVVEVGDYRIGFTGVTPVQYPHGAIWESLSGFRFHAPEMVLPPVLSALRAECHVVVLLSHAGYAEDQRLARLLPQIDLIVGGHSHTVLTEPTWVGGVPIVQTGSHGRYLGQVTMTLTAAGVLDGLDYQLIPCLES